MVLFIIAAIENQSDREFMESLYVKNYSIMYKKAISLVKSHHEAEDIVESVFIKLIDDIGVLRNCKQTALKSYLLSCVRNAAIDRLRRQKKQYSFYDVNERLESLPEDGYADDGLIRAEQIHSVACALKKLPDRERELLKMKYFDEMPDADTAELLGISRDSLRSRLNRARKKLAALIMEVEKDA